MVAVRRRFNFPGRNDSRSVSGLSRRFSVLSRTFRKFVERYPGKWIREILRQFVSLKSGYRGNIVAKERAFSPGKGLHKNRLKERPAGRPANFSTAGGKGYARRRSNGSMGSWSQDRKSSRFLCRFWYAGLRESHTR